MRELVSFLTGMSTILYFIFRQRVEQLFQDSHYFKEFLFKGKLSRKIEVHLDLTIVLLSCVITTIFLIKHSSQFLLTGSWIMWNLSLSEALAKIVFAPIFEEYFFRGVILSILVYVCAQRKWDTRVALFLQAVLFSIWHADFRCVAFLMRIVTGYLFGHLALLNNFNLFPSILIHELYNLIESF